MINLFSNEYIKKTLLYITVVAVVGVISFPLFWISICSIRPAAELFMSPPELIPKTFTLDNFKELFTRTQFLIFFRNSAIVAFSTTFLVVTIASLCAYSITRFKIRGGEAFMMATFFTYMFPGILLLIPIYLMLRKMGLYNNLLGLIFTYCSFSLPLAIFLLSEFFKTIPLDLERAAMIDGASRMKALQKIFLPLALPGIIATGVFAFIWAWGEFLYGLILISSESYKTLAPGISDLFQWGAIQWDLILAASIGVILPVVLMFAFVQRYLIQGFGAGAVKG